MLNTTQVQELLAELGYYHGALDGVLSTHNSRVAVKKFQSDKRLVADGDYGPKSDAALAKYVQVKSIIGDLSKLRFWRITSYYVTQQDQYIGLDTVPIIDRHGNQIGKCTPAFFAHTSLEGTGKLRDGRLINVDTVIMNSSGSHDWDPVLTYAKQDLPTHPEYAGIRLSADKSSVTAVMAFTVVQPAQYGVGYGLGKLGLPYNPFKSVATDIGAYNTSDSRYRGHGGLVPSGTKILIGDLIGLNLPDGTVHDGWVTANDTGSAIFGAHFDLFTGSLSAAKSMYYPSFAHVWFDGITDRVPAGYTYGLTTI